MPSTITLTFGADVKQLKKEIESLPPAIRQALQQATTHTNSFSESFGKLFARGDVGERRFHGLVGSVVRDLSTMQGGAEGAAQAVGSIFTRISGFGYGGGAAIAAAAIGFQRLVARGEELRKMASETTKELQQMGHALRLATAAEGFGTLADKAREAHKEVRKLRDEAAKDEEHFSRFASRMASESVRHPLRLTGGPVDQVKGLVELFQSVTGESAKNREKAQKAAELEAKFDDLAVQSQQKRAEIAQAELTGSLGQVEALKQQLELLQKQAQVDDLKRRDPKRGEEAQKALDAETAAQRKLNQERTEQQRRDFQAQMIQAQFTRQQAEIRSHLDMPRQREAIAASEVQAAKAAVEAAQIEAVAAEKKDEKAKQAAATQLQSAQTREIEAETNLRLASAQEDQARRDFQSKIVAGQFAQQQLAIQGRIIDVQNSGLTTSEKQLAIARERVALAQSGIEAAEAEVKAAEEQVEAAKQLGDEEKRTAAIRLQSAQSQVMQARNSLREAAGGVAEQRARQLEAAGREEEMSPQEKADQERQRRKQYEGLLRAAARQGIRGDLISPPQYGEAEYDPLRRFKAVATQEEIVKMSAQQGAQGAQQQLEVNKLLAQAGAKAPETPRAGQLGVLLPANLDQLKPEQRQKVEAQIPVMRVIGITGGTPVAVTIISDESPKTDGGGQGREAPAQASPEMSPQAQPPPPPMQPGVMPSPAPNDLPSVGGARGTNATTISGIRSETLSDLGITPESYANTDWAKVQEIQNNKDAYEAYWNRPDVQQGVQQQNEIGQQSSDAFRRQWGGQPPKQSLKDELTGNGTEPQPETFPAAQPSPLPSPEGPSGERPSGGGEGFDWQTAVENIPPEAVGITGPQSIAIEVAKQLANPTKASGAELTPRQRIAQFKRLGTKEDDPDYVKARQLSAQETQEEAFTKQKGLPLPDYIQKHRAQEEDEAAYMQQVQPPEPEMPQPPVPQVQPQQQQQAAPAQQSNSQGGGGDITAAIREAITSVMDRYWT